MENYHSTFQNNESTFEKWHRIQSKRLYRRSRDLLGSVRRDEGDKKIVAEAQRMEGLWKSFVAKKQELKDWAGSVIDISSFDAVYAMQYCHDWHEAMVKLGDGKFYEPTDQKNIIYKFSDGWTIQRLISQNDYQVEGNLMGHCVASYSDRTNTAICSMRDPGNLPHVTIEFDSDLIGIRQFTGKENKKPVKKYFDRMKMWYEDYCDLHAKKILSSPQMSYEYARFFYSNTQG